MVLSPALTVRSARGPYYDSDALAYCRASGATDRRAISDFVRGVKGLGLWDKCVCWPLRSAQNAGAANSDTVYSLGGLGTFNGTRVNGPTWEADGMQFATDATTNRNRMIDVPWSTVGGYDIRANSTVITVSNFGEVTGAGDNYDQHLFGSRKTANGGYGSINTRNGNVAGWCALLGPTSIGITNYATITGQTLPALWRMWSTQRENNAASNSNTNGNKLIRDTTLVASGSNAAQGAYAEIPNASETLVIGNPRGNTSYAPIGKISFVAVISDWTASVSAIRSLYVSTLGQGVLT